MLWRVGIGLTKRDNLCFLLRSKQGRKMDQDKLNKFAEKLHEVWSRSLGNKHKWAEISPEVRSVWRLVARVSQETEVTASKSTGSRPRLVVSYVDAPRDRQGRP